MHAPNANPAKTAIDGGVRAALKHDSGHKHVSGEAVYVDDIREPPGTLQVYIAMSERAHAAGQEARLSTGARARRAWSSC